MNCLPHLSFVAKVQDAYQILEELRDPTIYDASSEDSWAAEGPRELVNRIQKVKSIQCSYDNRMNKTCPFKSLRTSGRAAALGCWTAGGHRMEFRLPQLCRVSAEARQQGVPVPPWESSHGFHCHGWERKLLNQAAWSVDG